MDRCVHRITGITVTEKRKECLRAAAVWRRVKQRARQARPSVLNEWLCIFRKITEVDMHEMNLYIDTATKDAEILQHIFQNFFIIRVFIICPQNYELPFWNHSKRFSPYHSSFLMTPMVFPLLEAFLEIFFLKGVKSPLRICLDVFNTVKSVSFQRKF